MSVRLLRVDRADAHAQLRQALAAEAGVDAAELRIERTARGKPFLASPAGTDLRFNISHSGDAALIAIVRGREVGVDVQETRPLRRAEAIARRRFTAEEAEHVRAGGEPAFYRLWVRKEAYLKATGEGIGGGLASFDALRLEPVGGDAAGWEFTDLDAGPGYAAALAVAPPGYRPGG